MSGENKDIKLTEAESVMVEVLGRIAAEVRAGFERDLEQIRTEAKLAIAEVKLAAIEILAEQRAPAEAIARLRAVGGRQ